MSGWVQVTYPRQVFRHLLTKTSKRGNCWSVCMENNDGVCSFKWLMKFKGCWSMFPNFGWKCVCGQAFFFSVGANQWTSESCNTYVALKVGIPLQRL
jgi:hypothetical protein